MFQKNIQNDIIGIIDINGNLLVEYTYDAYGDVLYMIDESTNNLGTINPFRYRSYYYDNETGWYYLNSRYYNPQLGRFVTMDEVEYLGASGSLLGYNLYSYCENNPVNMVDPSGNDAMLVVDYNSGPGLPIVGHALLYYEFKGVWYKTQFSAKKKKDAHVTNVEMQNMTKDSIIKSFNSNMQYLYIAGNFDECHHYADHSTKYYPKYHFIRNNCLHYVKKVLLFGTIYNSYLSKYLKKSLQFVPAVYIEVATSINYLTKHTLQNIPSGPQITKKNSSYSLRRIY